VKRPKDSVAIQDSVKIAIPKTSSYFNLKILDLHGGEIFNATQEVQLINYLGNVKWLLTNDTLNFTFSIYNQKGDVDSMLSSINGRKKGMRLRTGIYDDEVSFFVKEFPNDNYKLKFEIFSTHKKIDEVEIPIKISRPFFLDESTWSLKVDQLIYIATQSEMNELKKAGKIQRDSLWRTFWKQYDPTPNTRYNEKEVEYFSRIEYSEVHFSHGDRGWRSDRAKIYVKYGPPDEIQSRPYEIHTRPYELWFYYRINQKFIFFDQHGFGQYILLNPQGSTI